MRRFFVQWIACALGLLSTAAMAADFETIQRTYDEYPGKTYGQFSDYAGIYEWGGNSDAGGVCDAKFKDSSESFFGGFLDDAELMRRMVIWFEGDTMVIRRFNAEHEDRGRLSYQSDFPLQSGLVIKIYQLRYDNGSVETVGLWSDKSEISWDPKITSLADGRRQIKYNFSIHCNNADDVVEWAKKTLTAANRPAFDQSALAASSPEFEQKCFEAPTRQCLLELATLDVSRAPENERDDALERVAEAQARTGDVAPALLQLAQSAQGLSRGDELKAIVVAEARAGKVDAARRHAQMILGGGSAQGAALSEVAVALAKAGRIAEASQLAASIDVDYARDQAFAAIVDAQASAGRIGAAQQIARSIKDQQAQQNALRVIAVAQAAAGDPAAAEKTTRSIQDDFSRGYAFADVVKALAAAGRVDDALRLSQSIDDKTSREFAIEEAVTQLTEAGKIPEALQLAKGIPADNVGFQLVYMTENLVKAGKIDDAAKLAQGIAEQRSRINAFGDIVDQLAQAGQIAKAEGIVQSIQDEAVRRALLSHVAAARLQAGQIAEAENIAPSILDWRSAGPLTIAAADFAKAGQAAEVARLAQSIQDADVGGSVLESVAAQLAQAGKVDEAEQVARSIKDDGWRALALFAIVGQLTKDGNTGAAAGIVAEIGTTKPVVSKDRVTADFLRAGIARGLESAGKFTEAESMARSIQDESSRAATLDGLVAELAKAGKIDAANGLAKSFTDKFWHGRAMGEIVTQLALTPRIADAKRLALSSPSPDETLEAALGDVLKAGKVAEALQLAQAFKDARTRDQSLESGVLQLAHTGKIAEATQLAQAIADDSSHDEALGSIARELAKAGKLPAGIKVLQAAKDSYWSDSALTSISGDLATAGQWTDAVAAVQAIKAKPHGPVLATLAESALKAGDTVESLRIARSIPDAADRAGTLSLIAVALDGRTPVSSTAVVTAPAAPLASVPAVAPAPAPAVVPAPPPAVVAAPPPAVTPTPAVKPAAAPAPPAAADCSLAEAHWKSAEEIKTIAVYQDHLARFPNCAFATLAKARIDQLSAPVAKPDSEVRTPPPPPTPAPPVQANAAPEANTVALDDFTTRNNRDIDGNDIPTPSGRIGFQVADINECAARCSELPSCVALSFDRWKSVCYLKSYVATSILDVSSTIAVKKPLQLPGVSTAQTKFEIFRNRRLRGDLIGRSADASFDACKTKCDGDLRCLGFNFMKQGAATSRCEMFKFLEGYDSDNMIDGGYKTQAEQ